MPIYSNTLTPLQYIKNSQRDKKREGEAEGRKRRSILFHVTRFGLAS